MNITFSLRKKIVSGNLLITLLIVVVGFIAIVQFSTFSRLVAYLTGSVAGKVRSANRIESEILSMRMAVEKFIYQNREEDRLAAEKHISRLNELLGEASQTLSGGKTAEQLVQIENLSREYIDKFNKVVIRIKARSESARTLLGTGAAVETKLYDLVSTARTAVVTPPDHQQEEVQQGEEQPQAAPAVPSQVDDEMFRKSLGAFREFLTAEAEANLFLVNYDKDVAEKVRAALDRAVKQLDNVPALSGGKTAVEDYLDAFDGLAAVALKMNEEIRTTLFPLAPRIIDFAEAVTDQGWEEMEKTTQDVKKKSSYTRSVISGICVFAILLGVVIGFALAQIIIKPIKRSTDGLSACAVQVSSGSAHIASTSQELAQGASHQAASIEETSSSLEEMAAMTKQNADNALQADTLMKEAAGVVKHAGEAMQQLTSSMDEIIRASEETSNIIKTIDEIAFQTNLLALNAAVEAARAGEAGRGFAVVAEEVRSLAQRSAAAARDTAQLIQKTLDKVHEGSGTVRVTNEAFEKVDSIVQKGGQLVAEITVQSNEQAQGIEQINRAVTDMDKVVQQNSATAEESASGSEQMSAQSQEMRLFVDELHSLISGKQDASESRDRELAGDAPRRLSAGKTSSTYPNKKPAKKNRNTPKLVAAEDLLPLDDIDV